MLQHLRHLSSSEIDTEREIKRSEVEAEVEVERDRKTGIYRECKTERKR
jgi:hypothetical protein